MADCDPSLIVRLVPLNERTRNAWKDPHNAPFYVPASFQGFQRREGSSRETTPYEADIATQNKVSDEESEIRLTLNDIPKDVTQGFMFGRSKSSCDVYCGERSDAYNISGQAFSITINKKGQVILKYLTPKSNISVQYGDQEPGVRTTFTWILFPECKKGIVIKVAEELVFGVIMPLHGDFAEEYRKGCYEYVANVESAVASIPVLGVESQSLTTDPSRIPTPNTKPFYYRCVEEELGRGSFGKVYLVRDVTTGKKYAGKEFHCDQVDQNEGHILAQQNHVSKIDYLVLYPCWNPSRYFQTNKVTSIEEILMISYRRTS